MTNLSTPKQRQKLGYLRKLLNIPEDTYREILFGYRKSESSKDLTVIEINQLIGKLTAEAKSLGFLKVNSYAFQKYKYNNLEGRTGYASPKQLRMVEAMWKDKSFLKDDSSRYKALRGFIKKITGKDDIKFLTPVDIRKLVKAMDNMKGEKHA